MGLLTELLSYELPRNQAWRAVAIEAPLGQGDLVAGRPGGAALPPGSQPERGFGGLCGGALICVYIDQLAGAGQVRGGRDGLIE